MIFATGSAVQSINTTLLRHMSDLSQHMTELIDFPLPDDKFRQKFMESSPEIKKLCGEYWLARTKSILTFQEMDLFPESLAVRTWLTSMQEYGWGLSDSDFRKLAVTSCKQTKAQVMTASRIFNDYITDISSEFF